MTTVAQLIDPSRSICTRPWYVSLRLRGAVYPVPWQGRRPPEPAPACRRRPAARRARPGLACARDPGHEEAVTGTRTLSHATSSPRCAFDLHHGRREPARGPRAARLPAPRPRPVTGGLWDAHGRPRAPLPSARFWPSPDASRYRHGGPQPGPPPPPRDGRSPGPAPSAMRLPLLAALFDLRRLGREPARRPRPGARLRPRPRPPPDGHRGAHAWPVTSCPWLGL
jgi:hypothetical protein